MTIELYGEAGTFISKIEWKFVSPNYKYHIYLSTPSSISEYLIMQNVPTGANKIWTITKSSTSITIVCNNVEVVNLVYADADTTTFPICVSNLKQSIKKIEFPAASSNKYRPAPGNTNLLLYICDI